VLGSEEIANDNKMEERIRVIDECKRLGVLKAISGIWELIPEGSVLSFRTEMSRPM
jgi:hypothetical protein